jgi:hypothetical protein
MRPTLAVAVAGLLLGALSCGLIVRRTQDLSVVTTSASAPSRSTTEAQPRWNLQDQRSQRL